MNALKLHNLTAKFKLHRLTSKKKSDKVNVKKNYIDSPLLKIKNVLEIKLCETA